ncbi:hypothetical protein C8Q74DRAFT_1234231 [Fomes fomentarius]|nr:hypothetical protein C8Q74DRAFT_1234231 [Fomes fomentarius]
MPHNPYSIWNRHPDDDHLFELDLDEHGRSRLESHAPILKFTDRAKSAQKAKWRRLYNFYAPKEKISRALIPSESSNRSSPRLFFGWAYKREYLKKYAEWQKLELQLPAMFVKAFGKTVIRFGELTEEEARDSDLAEFMDQVAISLVHRHLEKETHIQLDDVRPFTDKYDYMFAMYTNVDAIERHDAIDDSVGISKVVEFMNNAMNHDRHESQLLWWYSWDDLHVGLSTAI